MAFQIGGFAFGGDSRPRAEAIAQELSGLPAATVEQIFDSVQAVYPGRLMDMQKSMAVRDPLTKVLPALQMFGMYDGIKDRGGFATVSNDVMRRMARKCQPIAAIIQTRCNQVGAFARVPNSRTDSGFKIVMRERKAKPTPIAEAKIEALQRAIMRCGITEPNFEDGEHTFSHFLRMVTRDSLILDAQCFEIRPGQNAKKWPVARWQAVDAALIRKVEPELYKDKGLVEGSRGEAARYVQFVNGKVEAEYTHWEMAYGIRNPVTDIACLGYGISELEMLIDIVTATLFATEYNKAYFTQNSVPAGILSVVGNMSEEQLMAFRQQWEAQIKGPGNYWKTPIIAVRDGSGVNYTPFKQAGSNDMSFHLWLQYLTTIACAVFCIHPEEIGLQAWSPGHASIGNESSPVARLKHSEDKGLVPIFTSLADVFNEMIIYRIDPDFEFEWQNLSEFDEMADMQYRQTRVSSFTTINEERKEMDLEELKGPWYNEVLNPLVFSAQQAEQQMAMQQEQQAQMMAMQQPQPGDEDIQGAMEGQGNGQEFAPGQDGQPDQGGPPQGGGGAANAKAMMMSQANAGSRSGATSTGKKNPVVRKSLADIRWGRRICNLPIAKSVADTLMVNGIDFVGDLYLHSRGDLRELVGTKGVADINEGLQAKGYKTIC